MELLNLPCRAALAEDRADELSVLKVILCFKHEIPGHFLVLPICGKIFFKEVIEKSPWHSFWPCETRVK